MDPSPSRCQVARSLAVIMGKWKVTILLHLLFDGTRRFGELKATMPGVTPKMLTAHLRELEEQDIVQRSVYAQVPPKVEYSLTEYGRTMAPILHALHEWGVEHGKHMQAKRATEKEPFQIAD